MLQKCNSQKQRYWTLMFSPNELNQVMRLLYPLQRVVKWHPAHFDMIDLNSFDQRNMALYGSRMRQFEQLIDKGLAFTAMEGDTIYAMFGIWQLWDGVYEAWLIPSKHISRRTIRFHRGSKLFFEHAANKLRIKRLQIMVCTENVLAVRWAKVCYFTIEGTAKHWGPQGDDYYMMARIF